MITIEQIKAFKKHPAIGNDKKLLAELEEQAYCDDSGRWVKWDKRYSRYQDAGFGFLVVAVVNQPAREYFSYTHCDTSIQQYDYH